MLTPASIENELNIITTVPYKCCADHSILMTSPLITAPVYSSLGTAAPVVWAIFCGLLSQAEQLEQPDDRQGSNANCVGQDSN